MRGFQTVLRGFSAVIFLVALLLIGLGTKAELLLGAHWPKNLPFDATLDSQDRFYGAAFLIYACLLWMCADDLNRYAPVLKAILVVFFVSGLARFVSLAQVGQPSAMIYVFWSSELIVPPILWV